MFSAAKQHSIFQMLMSNFLVSALLRFDCIRFIFSDVAYALFSGGIYHQNEFKTLEIISKIHSDQPFFCRTECAKCSKMAALGSESEKMASYMVYIAYIVPFVT